MSPEVTEHVILEANEMVMAKALATRAILWKLPVKISKIMLMEEIQRKPVVVGSLSLFLKILSKISQVFGISEPSTVSKNPEREA